MGEQVSGLVEVLAKAICAERYDCAEAAGWATCDHGFGYRDAEPLAEAVRAHLRAVAADEGVREAVCVAVHGYIFSRGLNAVDPALGAFLDHLDGGRASG